MSFLSMTEARLPPGFRFHPRDEELVCDYLEKKVRGGGDGGYPVIVDVDLNKCEPWDLPGEIHDRALFFARCMARVVDCVAFDLFLLSSTKSDVDFALFSLLFPEDWRIARSFTTTNLLAFVGFLGSLSPWRLDSKKDPNLPDSKFPTNMIYAVGDFVSLMQTPHPPEAELLAVGGGEMACVGGKAWYFYSLRDRKYATGQRTNRATMTGYWKATGKDRQVRRRGAMVGTRKTLVFYGGRAPRGTKTDWVMHEFRMESSDPPLHVRRRSLLSCTVNDRCLTNLCPSPSAQEDWVVCRVIHKSRGGATTSSTTTSCHHDAANASSLPPLGSFFADNGLSHMWNTF
ncbi:NAC domain-containing protein 21 [Musa troglodytarum]|uniref:NAC domain-containing protein 21 n=1 Tax=Musa troglodytarum TaxID=320322 RepID=A0A9E7H7B8_9LILI|nr:NAC domain-containing protein 21 [Musa troglodytarum]